MKKSPSMTMGGGSPEAQSPMAGTKYADFKASQYISRPLNEKSSALLNSTTSLARFDRELSPMRLKQVAKRASNLGANTPESDRKPQASTNGKKTPIE